MIDDLPPTPARPRAVPLGTFVLARTERLGRAGGRRLAAGVAARHDPRRLTSMPRLSAARMEAPEPAAPTAAPPATGFVDPFAGREEPVLARAVAAPAAPGAAPVAAAHPAAAGPAGAAPAPA